MLYELNPENWGFYVSAPTVENGILVFRSVEDPGVTGGLRYGVGGYQLPAYAVGDTLQWALLAETPTPPTTLDLVVAIAGSITNLAQYGIPIPAKLSWVITPPVTVDKFTPQLLAGIPEMGKEIHIARFLLGDPASIAQAIQQSAKGFPWGKALIATAAVLGIVWVAKKKGK